MTNTNYEISGAVEGCLCLRCARRRREELEREDALVGSEPCS